MSGYRHGAEATGPAWLTDTDSAGDGGQCVEAAAGRGAAHVRDSKDTERPALTVDSAAWASFVRFAVD
ncbi:MULTISPECIES: DUF397 domain-containing protein [unclassified Streptomyces]|uniref:DUF397 domain-containing protein n=1 Tax=unclassified Streptomyces TaxID=2593676 RepID=UPI0019034BB5|nr:DUF397 domain-containing protein [Streptomyces sp. HSG2]